MIGKSEFDAAVERINPAVAAANTVADSFGNKEATAMVRDIAALAGVDYDALMELAAETLVGAHETGRPSPKDHAEGVVHGIIIGAMAQQEADRG